MRALLPLFAFAIAGCDAATEVAGDTLETQARGVIQAQYQQVAENAGIAAGRVNAVCECTADELAEGGSIDPANLNRERIRSIVEGCVARTDPDGVGR